MATWLSIFKGALLTGAYGLSVIAAVRILYDRRSGNDALRFALEVLGWTMVVTSTVALIVVGMPLPSLPALAAAVIFVAANWSGNQRYRLAQLLALAARHKMPLTLAAGMPPSEMGPYGRAKLKSLQFSLQRGFPLSQSLERARLLSRDAQMLVAVGERCGTVDLALATISERLAPTPAKRGLVTSLNYLAMFGVLISAQLLFLVVKIAPELGKLLQDFKVPPPPLLQALFYLGWLIFPLSIGLIVLLAAGLIMSQVWARRGARRELLFGVLELAVVGNQPIEDALVRVVTTDSGNPPFRLRKAIEAILTGGSWIEALRNARLLKPSEVAVLSAAERSGNLGWVLHELASAQWRRRNYRAALAMQILPPLGLLVLGTMVALVALALWQPLVEIIRQGT